MKIILKKFFFIVLLAVLAYLFFLALSRPSNNRNWTKDQKILPYAKINNNNIELVNIRNFEYSSEKEYTVNYYNKLFDIEKIKSVDFILVPFSSHKGVAHTFLSFGFEEGDYVAISIEVRKEKGETFSAVKGLFNQFEIMYVVADEKDVVKLRSNYRNNEVFIYPGKTTKENIQLLFLDIIKKINSLHSQPQFYNTLTSSCNTNIMKHINNISPGRIPFSTKVLMPGYSDELALELGLLDTNLSLKEARKKYKINDKALKYANDPKFSQKIRSFNIK